MNPIITRMGVCTGDKERMRPFKGLLLITGIVASLGQLAFTLLRVCLDAPFIFFLFFFLCLAAFYISLGIQTIILPVITFWAAIDSTRKARRARWLLCGLALVGLQVTLLCVQLHQAAPWLNAHTGWQ